MTSLILLLLVGALPSAINDSPSRPIENMPFADLHVLDKLPAYLKGMPRRTFIKWAKAQNAMAYLKARQRADEWDARNPALDTNVQENNYDSTSTLGQSEKGTSTGANVGAKSRTVYRGRSIQRTYRDPNRWSGGSVVIINPYGDIQ